MALKHLPENTREEARAGNLQLGGPGFKYADLNRVRRLEALDRAFLAELQKTDHALAGDFQRYRDSGGKDRERLQESELLIKVAPHVGAFVARLFHIQAAHDALCERVRADQVVFQWKRHFVERRVLPNPPSPERLANMDPVELEVAYREVVDHLLPDVFPTADPERELAVVCATLQEALAKASRGDGYDADARADAEAKLARGEAWGQALAFHPALAARRKQ